MKLKCEKLEGKKTMNTYTHAYAHKTYALPFCWVYEFERPKKSISPTTAIFFSFQKKVPEEKSVRKCVDWICENDETDTVMSVHECVREWDVNVSVWAPPQMIMRLNATKMLSLVGTVVVLAIDIVFAVWERTASTPRRQRQWNTKKDFKMLASFACLRECVCEQTTECVSLSLPVCVCVVPKVVHTHGDLLKI